MSDLRPVSMQKYEKKPGDTHHSLVPDGVGLFHGFGVDYEEFESGAGNYSTAIVERPDGTIVNLPVNLVKFEDR